MFFGGKRATPAIAGIKGRRRFYSAIFALFICAAFMLAPGARALAAEYQPGFRTLGGWRPEPEMRLDLNIWYPASRGVRDLNFSPWIIEGALNARPAEGQFPLLLVSHSTGGVRFSYHQLCAFLARKGFVVVAPTHSHDSMDNMDDLLTWKQLENRVMEINEALRLALEEKDIAQVVDKSRIGLVGFGSGATAGLLLGGALPSCESWKDYCAQAGAKDSYCNVWAKEKIDALCANLPLEKSAANSAIRAIAAVAPGFGMIFDKGSFENFHTPLLLVAAGRDKFNISTFHCEAIARLLGKKAKYLDLPEADSGALMSPCPAGFATELPELCFSVTAAEREKIFMTLSDALFSFFSHYLPARKNAPPKVPGASSPTP